VRGIVEISRALLRKRPLPILTDGDKEDRGRLLVVAGSGDVAGAPLLTVQAALRAGAGKVAAVVPPNVAPLIALALPETRILPLPARVRTKLLEGMAAIVIGPGMDRRPGEQWAEAALASNVAASLLIDANAMTSLWNSSALRERRKKHTAGQCIVTPNAGELAHYSGSTKELVCRDPVSAAREASASLGAIVVLKGSTTIVATAEGKLFRYRSDTPGLAMSGSGDVLAGIIGGLLARGVEPLHASLWGVFLHAGAGQALGRSLGPIGYRASELSDQIPGLMHDLR